MSEKSRSGQAWAFELLSGLFGWIWIGGGIAALAFAGLAVTSGWSWWNVLFAVIVSAVAKWLAKGFLDNQRRVAFEADLVAKGMSPEDAARAWIEAYSGQGRSSGAGTDSSRGSMSEENRTKAEERTKIISEFGAFMERTGQVGGPQIWDVKELPYEKGVILDAICLEIVREKDEQRVELLKSAALWLADFQADVGDQPISMLGIDPTLKDAESLSDDELKAMAAKIAGNPDRERCKAYEPIVDRDLADIQAKLLAADQLRRDMPEEKKREVLG